MDILLASVIALVCVACAVLIHYEALLAAARLAPRLTIPPRTRILVVIAGAFTAHLVEIGFYAVVYYAMEHAIGLGAIRGDVEGNLLDYFYFSISMYTTLGVGDIMASGPMRLVAGIQSLIGLILITWSASFTYMKMGDFWQDHPGA